MTTIVDQPPPIHRPDQLPVWDSVISDFEIRYNTVLHESDDARKASAWNVVNDMRDRDKVGRQRYGTPLTTNNGRDHLVDAYQEMLDGAVYLKAAWLEGAQVRDAYYAQLDLLVTVRMMIDARETAE